ncbi:Uncharacterised protein [Mycobacterium tuberculosis]|nr:Uncharacterised protein [Mycobacterium tuberculosis]
MPWPVSTIARADPSPAFRMACVSSSTSWEFKALRRSGRCSSMVSTASAWVIPIIGSAYIASSRESYHDRPTAARGARPGIFRQLG